MNISELQRVPYEDLKTFEGRAKHLYKIQTKSGELKNFKFLHTQKLLNDIVEEEYERTEKENGVSQCKLIILKCRQIGATTYSNIRSLDTQIRDEGSSGATIAHDSEGSSLIYKIYLRGYDNLPEYIVPTVDGEDMSIRDYYKKSLSKKQINELGINLNNNEYDHTHTIKIKPDTKHYSGKRLGFEELDSITHVITAGKKGKGGLGGTLRRAHFSEAASYPDYESLMKAISPSIPKFADDVFMIVESTANGISGDGEGFYNEWKRSVKGWDRYKNGDKQTYRGLRPVFIPWYMIDEYEMPLAGGEYENIDEVDFGSKKLKGEFLEREQKMLNEGIYNPLTKKIQTIKPEKINWYRNILITDAQYDYSAARMFYPTTPEDAFASTSKCFFDLVKLGERKNELNNKDINESKGTLVWSNEGEVEFIESSDGRLTVWEKPDPKWKNRYGIGIDIAKGHEDGDYSVAVVKDYLEQRYVAMWYGKIDQISFAEVVSNLGIYYNEALLIPESNLDTVVETIKPSGTRPYVGEIYYEGQFPNVRWGFRTDTKTRDTLIHTHKHFLRENPLGYGAIPNYVSWEEHKNFIRHEKGDSYKYEAASGYHDDIIIGMSLSDVGENFMDEMPEKYKPSKIKQLINKIPVKVNRKYKRNSEVGR